MPAMTRAISPGAIAAAAALAVVISPVAPLRSQATPGWTPDLSMTIKRVSSVEPSPDGTRVAFVVGEALMEGGRGKGRQGEARLAHARRESQDDPAVHHAHREGHRRQAPIA